MKAKYKMFNLSTFFRMALVGVVSLVSCLLVAMLLSEVLDVIYKATHTGFWRELFNMLSQLRVAIGILVMLLGISLCSGWIMAPVFNDFSGIVADSLQIKEGATKEVKLPKALQPLEMHLNNTNKELRLWQYAVREAEQRKDDLVVYLAHDIRTPLTSILGYLELIVQHPELPQESRLQYAEIALRKSERMQVLVEELFEVTRFNVSQIELDKRAVNAAVFINQLAEEIAPLLAERHIQLEVENAGVETLFIDADKVARALDNILHNAARYTPEGERVIIRLAVENADNGDGAVTRTQISIVNTGTEVSQEKLNRFFEKFYRGDDARQSSTGGVGLGLAIAKNLIEAHGGTLTATNSNRVTTFTAVL